MSRFVAIAFFVLLASGFDAHAIAITVPGCTNEQGALPDQSQCLDGKSALQGTYFTIPPSVCLKGDDGLPIVGRPIDFRMSNGGAQFTDSGSFLSDHTSAITDAWGCAIPEARLMGYAVGPTVLAIDPLFAPPVTLSLTVLPNGVSRLEAVSGNHQSATVGTAYASPLKIQVFDAGGTTLANAAIHFVAPSDPSQPSVFFEGGANDAWVASDANGIATSPPFQANGVVGHGEVRAQPQVAEIWVPPVYFDFANMRVSGGGGTGGDGCGRQGKGNGNCGNSPEHSGGKG